MSDGGLINDTSNYGETFTCTSAVAFAGSVVNLEATAGTVDLASSTDLPAGFALTDTVPNPELMNGTDAVAGEKVAIFPIRGGVIFDAPLAASADITVGDLISVGASAGCIVTRTTQNHIIGVALESVDNSTGVAGAAYCKVYCMPHYIYTP